MLRSGAAPGSSSASSAGDTRWVVGVVSASLTHRAPASGPDAKVTRANPPAPVAVAALPDVANVAPPSAPIAALTPSPVELTRVIQLELYRLGCGTSEADGKWTVVTREGLRKFNLRTKVKLDTNEPSSAIVAALQNHSGRICPLECARGQRAEGDRCVVIGCDSGFVLGADGTCKRRPEPPPRKQVVRHEPRHIAPSAPAGGGGGGGAKCFSFNGKRYCE